MELKFTILFFDVGSSKFPKIPEHLILEIFILQTVNLLYMLFII